MSTPSTFATKGPAGAGVPVVLQQHVEDAVLLHATRTALARAAHVKLHQLGRFDERLAAHLDGLAVAGEAVRPLVDELSAAPSASSSFVSAVLAIGARDRELLDRIHALAGAVPETCAGLLSAFGWVEPAQLQGLVAAALDSPQASRRLVGLAASGMHRVDPGLIEKRRLQDAEPGVRARALRAAGELGKVELLSQLAAAIDDEPACRFWAAWSAVLLGDRQRALGQLRIIALEEGPFRQRALDLALLASTAAAGQELLRSFTGDPSKRRLLTWGIGLMGDPALVPWLIEQMNDDKTTRQAGESFSLITGADLALLDLERKPPEGLETGPNDDPDDPNVDMDADDGLPWPDVDRVQGWWSANLNRFVAGERYFIGKPVTPEHCIEVLKTGYQRQRMLAAFHRSLQQPGTPLFEWRAPAWRQQQALARL